MALMVLTAAYVNLTGPGNVYDHLSKAELTAEVEDKDVTTFASLGWKEVTGGLKHGQLAMTFFADYAAGNLDANFWTVFLAGVPIAFECRASQAAVSTSNPKYTGLVLPKSLVVLSGAVGDVGGGDVTWPTSGAITRATA